MSSKDVLKGLLILQAVLALFFGIGYIFAPGAVLNSLKLAHLPASIELTRDLGVPLIAFGVMNWLARNSPKSRSLTAILAANFTVHVIGLVIKLTGTKSNDIPTIVMHIIFGAGFGYYLFFDKKYGLFSGPRQT